MATTDLDVAFPVLSAKDVASLIPRGHLRQVKAGEILFAEGDRDFCFYVVLEGAIEIVQHANEESPKVIVTHRKGQFTGVENYLGFPTGISGEELTKNALIQAQRFGAHITVPCTVRSLGIDGGDRVVTLADNTRIRSRCVLVASGVQYRKLDVPWFEDFDGAGIYYAATDMEARMCGGEDVVVVGAGNSAGQAVVHLSRYARRVEVIVRGPDLGASMSRYLVDRLEALPNVTIRLNTRVTGLEGDGHLSAVQVEDKAGATATIATSSLFLFIGADPNTSWLRGCVDLDKKGFVLTGSSLPSDTADADRWKALQRQPFLLETQPARGVRRGGRAKRLGEAGGVGGGRRVDVGELCACAHRSQELRVQSYE